MSILGVNSMLEKVYQNTYNSYNTDIVNGMSFSEKLSNVKENASFENMWKSRFPGAYYHVADAYKISQGVWGRYDFPHEKFFSDELDESVLNWKPTGAAPKLTDPSVQSRIDSTLGKMSIVVPPALEEKMKNNPALAQKVMAKVENFIAKDKATLPPGRMYSCVVTLDEDGELSRCCSSSGGGGLVGPTEEEQRQFEAEQKKKAEKKAEYMRILEESAIKRAEIQHNQYQKNLRKISANKSLATAYEKNNMPYDLPIDLLIASSKLF